MVSQNPNHKVTRLGSDDRKTTRLGFLEEDLVGRDNAMPTTKLQIIKRVSSD